MLNTQFSRTVFKAGFIALLAMLLAQTAISAPVHVAIDTGRSQEYGAGISVGRGSDCFVVVPAHVIEFAREIVVTDKNGRSSKASRFQAAEGADAALLKVEAGHTLDCPEDWVDGLTGESQIGDADFLVSRKALQQGIKQSRFFVSEISQTEIQVQSYTDRPADELKEGDSGSSLYANSMLVGMIVSVDTATGVGHALKQSQLHSLFGNLVLDQSMKTVLVNPVMERNTENIHATYAVREYFEKETPLKIAELHDSLIADNIRNEGKGVPPTYPDEIDYVITTKIIENKSNREENPNYKPNAKKSSNSWDKIKNSAQNRKVRYLYVSNVDVQVRIYSAEEDSYATHLEQVEYKVALKKDVDERELQEEAPIKASVDAIKATVEKFNLPVNPKSAKKPQSLLRQLFGKKEKKILEAELTVEQ